MGPQIRSTRPVDYNDDKWDKVFIGIWLAVLAFCGVFWLGVAYIVLHFVAKVW